MLYNLYRPTDFSEVKGQEDVLVTMKRQAQTGRFGHAYLLAGHRGTGKNDHCAYPVKSHQLRKPYRKRTLQGMPKLPCSQNSMDIKELDAATNNGVDHIKELTGQAKYRPVQLKNKVFIIDEVHNLSAAAFDVLLKPLEEPPAHCTFILCTTELHKIPVTIRSRCETYTFHPISPAPMKERLREVLADQKADCDEDALNLIIRSANGGMRDALGILEQLMAGSGSSITAEAAKKQLGALDTDAILNTLASVIRLDTTSALSSMDNLLFSGKSPSLITETSLRVLTDMVTMKSTGDRQSIMHSRDYIETVWNLGHEISFNRLYWLCEQFCDLRTVIRQSTDPVLDLRLALIRLSHQDIVSSDPIKLAEEVSMLKKEIEQLKGIIQKHPHTAVQEDDCTASEPETVEEPAAESGFYKIQDCDIPFAEEEQSVAEENEYANAQDDRITEGGMPPDREEEETVSEGFTKEVPEDDISASDLFKILG